VYECLEPTVAMVVDCERPPPAARCLLSARLISVKVKMLHNAHALLAVDQISEMETSGGWKS
jgi:hypothetical protein